MLHVAITPTLFRKQGVRNDHTARRALLSRASACLRPIVRHARVPETAVLRPDLLIILVLAIVAGAVTASATGHFEPLPLFAGVIVAGVIRSVRMARQRG